MSNQSIQASTDRTKFPVKIKCPKCGQTGSALWEENIAVSPRGPMSALDSVSDGFIQRTDGPSGSEVVCRSCGTVVPD